MSIVKEYDKQLLYPMLLKCYHNLHPMAESKVGHVDQKIDENFNLNFFNKPLA